jgi:ankyrin repeat protein
MKNEKIADSLIQAIWNNDLERIQSQITNNIDLNSVREPGYYPLYEALERANDSVVELLIAHGAEINFQDFDGYTTLFYAVTDYNVNLVQKMLNYGANVNHRTKNGDTPLTWLTSFSNYVVSYEHEESQLKIIQILIEKGVDVNATDNEGITALMQVSEVNEAESASLLLDSGAQVDAKDFDGWTSLMYAAMCGAEAILRLLIMNGANVNEQENTGRTALMIAASRGQLSCLSLLLEAGADPEIKSNDGMNATDYAKEGFELNRYQIKTFLDFPWSHEVVRFHDGSGVGLVYELELKFEKIDEHYREIINWKVEHENGEIKEVSIENISRTGVLPIPLVWNQFVLIRPVHGADYYAKSDGLIARIKGISYDPERRKRLYYIDVTNEEYWQEEIIALKLEDQFQNTGSAELIPSTHFPLQRREWKFNIWHSSAKVPVDVYYIGAHGTVRALPNGEVPIWNEECKSWSKRFSNQYKAKRLVHF